MGSTFAVVDQTEDAIREAAARAGLALRVDELQRIAGHLGRDPSMVEAYAFDAQWSEHCSYKSSRHHLRNLPASGPDVVLGPSEDSGILHLGEHNGERYGVVIAHESHNHPSQVVPFEGAATGVGGIVRDVLCMGAEVVAIADPLRFGRIEDPDTHQRYVATSVVDGIAAYGNAIGVPNIAGDVYFDDRFDDNCLVNVVALGIIKESEIIHSKAPPGSNGWDIVLVGKATDASGFGGAAFSSLALDAADAQANKGAVQVPDPFLKNVIMRASYRVFEYLREHKITAGFKDLGAGGIMGCTAEICSSGGFGAIIDLDDVSTAQPDLPPAVIAIGETQERLTWVVPPEVTPEILRIYNEEFTLPQIAAGACAAVIGCVQQERRYVMRHGSEIVMDVDIDFLTGPIRDELPFDANPKRAQEEAAPPNIGFDRMGRLLRDVLAHRDVCSRAPLYKQYDSVVRGMTVVPRNDFAGVMAAVPGSALGFAVGVGGNPRYGKIDSELAAEHAVLDAVRAVVAVGAKPVGLTDCLNFGNPQNREHYTEFVSAVSGLARAARELQTPYVSGNVSLYNESKRGTSVPPSAIVACVGALDDISRVITPRLRSAGLSLFWIGGLPPLDMTPFGGSVIADVLRFEARALPPIDYDRERRSITVMQKLAAAGAIDAAIPVGNGGIIIALARLCFSASGPDQLTAVLAGSEWCGGDALCWFAELGGYVVAVPHRATFERLISPSNIRSVYLGSTKTGTFIEDTSDGRRYDLEDLYACWQAPLTSVYG